MVNGTPVTAWCEAGGHEYKRDVTPGRPPLSCPVHRSQPKRPPEVGAKISAAKKGVRQIKLAPGELTLTEAGRVVGIDRRTLHDGFESGKLRGRPVERPGNQRDVIVVDLEQLREDLARCPCSYPGCDAPAPGRSGRCGDHAARGEPAVELTCDRCGRRFTRPVSWLAEREGRGRYCSNRCKGEAFHESRPGYLSQLNRAGAHDHQVQVAETIKAEGLLDTKAVATAKRYSVATVIAAARADPPCLPSELRVIDGSLRRVYHPADAEGWDPAWSDADGVRRRARIARKVHGRASERGIYSRNKAVIQAKESGKVVGRPGLEREWDKRVYELADGGMSQRDIATKLTIERTKGGTPSRRSRATTCVARSPAAETGGGKAFRWGKSYRRRRASRPRLPVWQSSPECESPVLMTSPRARSASPA